MSPTTSMKDGRWPLAPLTPPSTTEDCKTLVLTSIGLAPTSAIVDIERLYFLLRYQAVAFSTAQQYLVRSSRI